MEKFHVLDKDSWRIVFKGTKAECEAYVKGEFIWNQPYLKIVPSNS